uniref:3-ketoacyl-CoA thiolase, mitochondrial n=1 Tax=Steinernema glaseri TaxID=37863 RepID=A0A1I7ZLB4_9BILA
MSKARIFVVGAKRTAFGTFGGQLKARTATDLAEISSRAAIQAAAINPENVDHVVMGNVLQTSADAPYLARHVGLRVGLPENVPAVTVNRLCGSGFEAIVQGSYQIIAGDARVVLVGGTESMSQAPFVVRNTRFGTALGTEYKLEDSLWTTVTDMHIKTPMGLTAEKLGAQYKLTRAEVDEFAHRSQQRWRLANNAGYFNAEIQPITSKTKKGEVVFDTDEHPRDTTPEGLAKLPPVFQKDGLVTAGNASGICDGAASLVLADEASVQRLHLQPLARIVGWHTVGCDPSIMGIGPAPAISELLRKTGLKLEDVDLVEVNEAFAAQTLAVQKELKIEGDKLNVNGGAIALGHPLGASGARISGHLAHELRRRDLRYGIGAACIGGGQGIAILFEKV